MGQIRAARAVNLTVTVERNCSSDSVTERPDRSISIAKDSLSINAARSWASARAGCSETCGGSSHAEPSPSQRRLVGFRHREVEQEKAKKLKRRGRFFDQCFLGRICSHARTHRERPRRIRPEELPGHGVAVEAGHDVVDHGPQAFDAEDDYPVFCFPAAEATVAEPGSLCVVIGGSATASRSRRTRCRGTRGAGLEHRHGQALPAAQRRQRDLGSAARMHTEKRPSSSSAFPGHAVQRRRAARPSHPVARRLRSITLTTRTGALPTPLRTLSLSKGGWRSFDRLRHDLGPGTLRSVRLSPGHDSAVIDGRSLKGAGRPPGPATPRSPRLRSARPRRVGRDASRARIARSTVTSPETPSRPKSRGQSSRLSCGFPAWCVPPPGAPEGRAPRC